MKLLSNVIIATGLDAQLSKSYFFGLDFPLGVQTLLLACSVMMMMMESNYAVHVL